MGHNCTAHCKKVGPTQYVHGLLTGERDEEGEYPTISLEKRFILVVEGGEDMIREA